MKLAYGNQQNGFTLIELLITISVAGILLSAATPSFTSMIKNNRLLAQESAFIAGLNLARSEAIKRAHNVVLCRSANGSSCAGSGGSSDWDQGWIIYADANSNGTLNSSSETILKVQSRLSGGNTFKSNSNFTNNITYRSTGFSTSVGTFWLCDDRGSAHAREFIINASGRARLADATQCEPPPP